MVSAAMSLRDAFTELGKLFEKRNPGARVRFNFASSGTLATQIIRGAPADLFASASVRQMERVVQGKMIRTADCYHFARNTLVIIQPRGVGKPVRRIEDLGKVGKIALGNPGTVPAGRYARKALKHHKLWAGLKNRLVFAEHVRQVLTYVARGEVDAGIVYSTDYQTLKKKLGPASGIPSTSHPPIVYPVGVLKETKKRKLALKFVLLLRSREGRRILAAHGFKVPAADRRTD